MSITNKIIFNISKIKNSLLNERVYFTKIKNIDIFLYSYEEIPYFVVKQEKKSDIIPCNNLEKFLDHGLNLNDVNNWLIEILSIRYMFLKSELLNYEKTELDLEHINEEFKILFENIKQNMEIKKKLKLIK